MTLVEKISKSYLQKLKNKAWYHQRFDGSPMFMSYIAFAEVRQEKRKPRGTKAQVTAFFQVILLIDLKDAQVGRIFFTAQDLAVFTELTVSALAERDIGRQIGANPGLFGPFSDQLAQTGGLGRQRRWHRRSGLSRRRVDVGLIEGYEAG